MKQHLEDLSEIRAIMERSSKFISLSGMSGICAGSFALIGAFFAYNHLSNHSNFENPVLSTYLITDGLIVLVLSLITSIFFTVRQSIKKKVTVWNATSQKLLINMVIPLATGGIFCIILLKECPYLIDSATLVFYGLAIINASKYTFDDVKYLGYIEIILGLIAGFVNNWEIELLIWAIGFGILHIIYGIIMYRKYDVK